ncbi:MAG: IS1595 family transposase [Bacteroidales bacterium]|nr:IS1595 family transposase [Bacteroidales bacterium]
MKTTSFNKIIHSVPRLNTYQYRILREHIESIASRKFVSQELETPYDHIVCPHCTSCSVQRWGKRNDLQRYKCKDCRKTFNSLSGTPLARLRRKGHWIDYAQCMKEGLSLRKAASECGIHYNTAFKWRHRFLEKSKFIKAEKLNGIVEAGEFYFRKSQKGSKRLERPGRERGFGVENMDKDKDFICVFVGRDRNRNTFDAIFEEFNAANLKDVFHTHLSTDALLCSDSSMVYKKYSRENRVRHGFLNLSKGEVVKKDIVHIRNVNAYQSQLKDWVLKRFRGVATKYLSNYLSWYRELDEFNDDISPLMLLMRAKFGGIYKNLPLNVTQQTPIPISP